MNKYFEKIFIIKNKLLDFVSPIYYYGYDFGYGKDRSVVVRVQRKRNGQILLKEIIIKTKVER